MTLCFSLKQLERKGNGSQESGANCYNLLLSAFELLWSLPVKTGLPNFYADICKCDHRPSRFWFPPFHVWPCLLENTNNHCQEAVTMLERNAVEKGQDVAGRQVLMWHPIIFTVSVTPARASCNGRAQSCLRSRVSVLSIIERWSV